MLIATVFKRWSDIESLWAEAANSGHCTPFQQPLWLETWFKTVGYDPAIEPLLVAVQENGDLQLALPLIRIRRGAFSIIEPADLGVTDYNAPLIAAACVGSRDKAMAVWAAVKRALPPADIVRITKMPATIDGVPNPLTKLPSTRTSRLNGNLLSVEGPWSEYHNGLERTFRKEIERSWRVFCKYPAARFEQLRDPQRALQMLRRLERQQAERMKGLGKDYVLDDPRYADHYRKLVESGLASGAVRLSALLSGEDLVAALFGITHGPTFAMVRISTGGERWKGCSPGRLIIYKTMEAMHAEGLRHFDYTIGDYAYKRRMGANPFPLFDLVEAMSVKGWLAAMAERLRADLRQNPVAQKIRTRFKRS